MMMDEKDIKEFSGYLINFYKEFLLGTSKSVEILAKIEKEYPEEYKMLKELKDDPAAIAKLSDKIPDDVRTVFYFIVMESSGLAERMNKVFELSQEDKVILAKDIRKFSERVKNELNRLGFGDKDDTKGDSESHMA